MCKTNSKHALPPARRRALSNVSLQGTLPASWDCMETSRCGLASLQALWLVSSCAESCAVRWGMGSTAPMRFNSV